MWFRATSGYSRAASSTTSRQKTMLVSTLALSTEVTFLRRSRAASKAMRAMRAISPRVYTLVSQARSSSPAPSRPLGCPK